MGASRMRTVLPLAGLLLLTWLPGAARAEGPGMHVLEADRVLDQLAASDPAWAARAALPLARAHLRMGAISPDFQWVSPALGFGHSLELAYHLVDRATTEGDDLHLLFALGHLAHNTSDPAGECFLLPTYFGSAPLGMFDLFQGNDGALGESESIMESYGDLLVGDWQALIDLLFDLWLDSDQARAQAAALLGWYCQEGASFLGRATDCDRVVAEIAAKLEQAEPLLGGLGRDGAHQLVASLTAAPADTLLDLVGSGVLTSLLGEVGQPSAEFPRERARFLASPLADRDFWSWYDQIGGIGPAFALDALAQRPLTGWPDWDPQAIVCGNVQSVMQFLPDAYHVRPGLLVDELDYQDGEGHGLATVGAGEQGAALTARLVFFSALPLQARVRGVVRKDRAGLDCSADEVLGQAELQVAIDPLRSMLRPRSELLVLFTADTEGALGYYVELYVDDDPLPTFTTSWDRLWTIAGLDLDRPLYRDNFGTYGHWPPSLPVADPPAGPATLLVKVQLAPQGGPIAGAAVQRQGEPQPRPTGANGLAVFDGLAPGPQTVSASAAGYASSAAVGLQLASLEQRWLEIALHAVPAPVLPAAGCPDGSCLPLTWNAAAFEDQATAFLAQPELAGPGADGGEAWAPLGDEVELRPSGRADLCLPAGLTDGSKVRVRLLARYGNGTVGVEGFSAGTLLDARACAAGDAGPRPDAGTGDAGSVGPEDGGAADAGSRDSGEPPDAGPGDGGVPADSTPDVAVAADAGRPGEARASEDGGCGGCSSAAPSEGRWSSLPGVGLLALLLLRRR